jgi:hypothetical protein
MAQVIADVCVPIAAVLHLQDVQWNSARQCRHLDGNGDHHLSPTETQRVNRLEVVVLPQLQLRLLLRHEHALNIRIPKYYIQSRKRLFNL